MVYSAELGYDPEEWEECPPPDHFLAFGWFTRIILAAGAIGFAFLFFYVLEKRKDWAREERRASFSAPSLKPDEIDALIKRTERERSSHSQPQHLATANGTQPGSLSAYRDGLSAKRPKKRMSEADMAALLQWNRQLKEIEQRRLEEAKEVDRRARASAPPQQYQYMHHGSQSPPDSTPPTFASSRQHPMHGAVKQLSQPQSNVDSPARAPTPPSTPPGPPIPPHGAQLQEEYKRLATELQQKLNEELLHSKSGTTANEFQQRIRDKHGDAVRAAEQNLRERGTAGEQAAQQFRETFENQLDSMVEEYNRRLARVGVQTHSSNESDGDHFEQISASPAMFYPSESDEPDNEASSFAYESGGQGPRHARTTIVTHQQDAHVPELLVNNQKLAGVKKSSSSSEEGFVKIYSDLVEKIDKEGQRARQSVSPAAEAQLKEILQEYDTLDSNQPTHQTLADSDTKGSTTTVQTVKEEPLKKQLSDERKSKSKSKSPHGSRASSSRQSPDFEAMFPVQSQPQVPVKLAPLAGFQGNFLQQYQQGPDGRLYPQGPDGMFYRQNKKGQLTSISTELQDILQRQQQDGLQQPLIKTTDGNIYQQGANGQFYEQAADGQMYKVPPNIQKVIQQEIQQTLQLGDRKSSEPQELIKGPDGATYEKGPLGQFYEQGPDGKLHRVSPDIQRQLLDLVEEQKQDVEKQQQSTTGKKATIDPYQKRPTQIDRQLDPAILQFPDGKIYEKASDGQFYQLGSDGRLYRIPHEMQPILEKQHKKFLEQAQKRAEQKGGSVDEPTPPFDPEYPYHPRRRLPMQPNPNAPEEDPTKRPELKRQQNDEQTPPILLNEQPLKPKPLEAKDVHNVKELLQEYDLSASIDAPRSHYDQPATNTIQAPERDEREHRPSPEDAHQFLKTPEVKTGHSTPDSALDFDLLQPEEIEANLRSHPSPSQSSGHQLQLKDHEDLHRSATQPPIQAAVHEPKPHRDASEQSHKQRAQKIHEHEDDPRRLVEADIYLQDAIEYVDNQQANKTESGFVMEEDMLSSSDKIPLKMQNASADPTSRLVPTNEVFEKPETTGFEDADDAVTFAPDIQTVEIPPDQLSQNSSNYIDNLPDEEDFPNDQNGDKLPASSPLVPNPQLPSQQTYPEQEGRAEKVDRVEQEAPTPLVERRHQISIQHAQHLGLGELPECEVPPRREPDLLQQAGIEPPMFAAVSGPAERDATHKVDTLSYPDYNPPTSAFAGQIRDAPEDEPFVDERRSTECLLRMRPERESSGSPFFKVEDEQERRPSAPQFWRRKRRSSDNASVTSSKSSRSTRSIQKQSSLLSALGCTSIQEMMLGLSSLDELSEAMRKAGLERTNLIFGIDYTASNKYQGEHSFDGRSLHCVDDPAAENPYQQVIKIMGRTLAPFASNSDGIPAYGFGDNESGDWGVFPLNGTTDGVCKDLADVLKVYNEITPTISLGGPTNFAPLIYQAIQICQRVQDYHILVIIADGQVTNERATRKAIVQACQFPLSIIVVGIGDGPWEMMKLFDESLPKRPWDNFHFLEYHQLVKSPNDKAGELAFAIHTLLEIPDQYRHIVKLGMLPP